MIKRYRKIRQSRRGERRKESERRHPGFDTMPTLMEVEIPSSKGSRPPSSPPVDQNETTFDDSATVLSRNLLDDTVLSKNLLDETILPNDGDGDNNNDCGNIETNNYLDGSETFLSDNTFFGGEHHNHQDHGDNHQQHDDQEYIHEHEVVKFWGFVA